MVAQMGLLRLSSGTVGSGPCSGSVQNVRAAVGRGIRFLCL